MLRIAGVLGLFGFGVIDGVFGMRVVGKYLILIFLGEFTGSWTCGDWY